MKTATHQKTGTTSSGKRPRRSVLRRLFLPMLACAFVLFCLFDPLTFQFCVRQALRLFSAYSGQKIHFGRLTGNPLRPFSFYQVEASLHTSGGATASFRIDRLDLGFAWSRFFQKERRGFLRSVVIDGLEGTVSFPSGQYGVSPSAGATRQPSIPFIAPASLEMHRTNLLFRQGSSAVEFRGLGMKASEIEAGNITVNSISIRQPWLQKDFPGVRGTTAFDGSKLIVGDLMLEPGVRIHTLSWDLSELRHGGIAVEYDLSAFHGAVRGEVKGVPEDHRLNFDAAGSFSQISIEELARFVNAKEPAGGTIHDGKFAFYGSPRNFEKATVSIRLEATDFLLGKRRWNSLVLGATLFNRRLQIPEFHLKQAHNELTLTGQMAIPAPGQEWWQSEFAFDLAAKIQNLTELSVFFGPEFGETYGQATIDGSIRGENSSFDGQLIVGGSHLAYRGAPLDVLHAAIKLHGNELQFSNIEFLHLDDYIRGQGVINILGEKRYWGELKASLAELALYSAVLKPPLVPQQFAGGLSLDWSGDGTAKAHSGAFTATLRKIRPLVDPERKAESLDAVLEATYAPENIFFSKFSLANKETSFTAKVTADPKSLTLQSLRLQNKGAVWLEGNALLPVNLWAAWENPSSAFIDLKGPLKLSLDGQKLQLHEALALSGRDLPIKGDLSVKMDADGTPSSLTATGRIKLTRGDIPFTAAPLAGTVTDADLSSSGSSATVADLKGMLNGADFVGEGNFGLSELLDPKLALSLHLKKAALPVPAGRNARADLDLNIGGELSHASVEGGVRLEAMDFPFRLDLISVLNGNPAPSEIDLSGLRLPAPPLANWTWNLHCFSSSPLPIGAAEGRFQPDLQLSGSGSSFALTGKFTLYDAPVPAPSGTCKIDHGDIFLTAQNPGVPLYDLHVNGSAAGYPFSVYIFGPASAPQVALFDEASLPVSALISLITTGALPNGAPDLQTPASLHLEMPAPANDGNPLFTPPSDLEFPATALEIGSPR